MPIQGIDNLLIAPRSQESSNVRQHEVQKAPTDQSYLMNQMQNTVSHNSHVTTKATETDQGEEKFDAKEKGKNEYERRKQEKKRKEEEEKLRKEAGIGGSYLDIQV